MNRGLQVAADSSEYGWTRVSSFKPQLAAALLAVIGLCSMIVLLQDAKEMVPLVVAGIIVATGLIALNCKVIHKRGNEYRISSLFYSEVVTVDDVCMTVTKHGPFWPQIRIHLRRPARFGWTISFVPTEEARLSPTNGVKPTEA